MNKKVLGVFQLVMINVIAVDSIRSLAISAEYGFSLVFFYILAGITFFIPSALISAELGSGWPNTGGIYIWVREAFGNKWSLIIIWLNWIYNVVWYPTIMALIAGTLTYMFNPALATNKLYISAMILVLFWGATYINCLGMKASSWLSTAGAIVGTILPMVFISILGLLWVFKGHTSQIAFTLENFFPSKTNIDDLAFLSSIFFGLIGLEMAATHAAEMRNPTKDYPKAIGISVVIILITIVFASLSIAIAVPKTELSLVTGALQGFKILLDRFNLGYLVPVMALFIVLGGLGSVGAWVIGPTKGLLVASRDGSLPSFLSKVNKHGAPVRILVLQGAIVSLLCFAFVIMPTVNSSFWLLSAITAQLAMVVYLFLFLSGIKLHFDKPDVPRAFRIPFGRIGIIVTTVLGALSCIATIGFGFIPPKMLGISNILEYELSLIGGMALLCILPYLIHRLSK
ncbi:amino acid permease [Candidatus Aerophobetes bacterium]|uniref:Amino acid permease n=1 Tax=Aerophobetes bacterium TaxID=2030807 RepID=A0A2A4YEK0_UNCAE|nr:MAG: amino acid permease [Candidatus Aerophobetes bacterium]